MAIFHLSVKTISRGKGQSAIASSAYRSGEKLYDERTGETQDYSHKRFIEHSEIQLPDNAPKEYSNRQTLWNAVEKAEKRNDAQLAREVEVALPRELTSEQRIKLVHDFVQKNFVDHGMVADWSIHNPQPDKNNPDKPANPHAHIMLTIRSIKANGQWAPKRKTTYKLDKDGNKIPQIDPKTGEQKIGAKGRKMWKRVNQPTNDWNDRGNVEKWRANWAKECNQYLAPEYQIDHRSYKRQGIDKIPTEHEGHYAQQLERNEHGSSWKVARNVLIRQENEALSRLKDRWQKIVNELKRLRTEVKRQHNLVKEQINARLKRAARTLESVGQTGQDNQNSTKTNQQSIGADTDALLRETEAQRSLEAAQRGHATSQRRELEAQRKDRAVQRSRQSSKAKSEANSRERQIEPSYKLNKSRSKSHRDPS